MYFKDKTKSCFQRQNCSCVTFTTCWQYLSLFVSSMSFCHHHHHNERRRRKGCSRTWVKTIDNKFLLWRLDEPRLLFPLLVKGFKGFIAIQEVIGKMRWRNKRMKKEVHLKSFLSSNSHVSRPGRDSFGATIVCPGWRITPWKGYRRRLC